ncbi:hypothetical protein LOTGIDRAFT_175910 [Lottia gigantea]|uniref:Alpha-N-acetylglucosaminidase C-terminal domain-containing protein n=1 Tax=Lottia gigantea TaxID=225164 RepID=V4A4A3_LOTGI|nr:hypothetical protein LOTGIDRAFT_175910 [Lottia gigantea]ESO88081.1 hypothetical protein LOTGIDRAFT_175910 [Lottia gigantea]
MWIMAKIVTQNGKVQINGTSGVGVAMGFYYYIKYYCGGQFTWAGQQINLPTPLPVVPSPGITKTSNDRFRYYQNVCTVSYSLVWLNWTRWERHIDWMALQGINLPLAFTGQEAIFQRSSVYNCDDGHGDFDIVLLTRRPGIGKPRIWYSPKYLYQAWDLMVKASPNFNNSDLFRYDLVDITRNSLQVISMKMYSDILMAYSMKNSTQLKQAGDRFIILLSQLEKLLASDRHFLLANWLDDSKQWGSNSNQSRLYEYNARNQITLWGPNGEIVDYASKQWAGLFADFYQPRWQLFIDTLMNCVQTGKSFNGQAFNADVLEKVEKPFTFSNKVYSGNPVGDSMAIVKTLHDFYRPQTIQDELFYTNLSRWSRKNKYFMKNVKRWNRKQYYKKKLRTHNRYVIQMNV